MSEAFMIVAKRFTFLANFSLSAILLKNMLQSDLLLLGKNHANLLPIALMRRANV